MPDNPSFFSKCKGSSRNCYNEVTSFLYFFFITIVVDNYKPVRTIPQESNQSNTNVSNLSSSCVNLSSNLKKDQGEQIHTLSEINQ